MAAGLPPVDLQTAAKVTKVPYGTLTRWASENAWIPERHEGRKLFYAWDLVSAAVSARQERAA